jgi:long-subunit fatty acid transport protein
MAAAGGLERTPQSTAVLFEEGRYLELSFGAVAPSISGTLGGFESGNMTDNFFNLGAAYKADLNDTWSYAVIFDQPFGADPLYPGTLGPGSYPFAGSVAQVRSNALTGILQYNMGNGGSVFGGLRAQSLQASANLPVLGFYDIASNTDFQLGYLVGAAYERPDIALRVALTYNSAIDHELDLTESNILNPAATVTQDVTLPQSLNLEFQTGVAEDTLVFGSVRWVEWSETVINPPLYATLVPLPLVFFEDDRITYTLGVGRRLNDTWSVLGSVSYEESTGSITGNLGPTDGFTSVSLGAIYRKDNMKITGGIRYVDVGGATSFSGAEFSGNSAVAAGVKIGWTF